MEQRTLFHVLCIIIARKAPQIIEIFLVQLVLTVKLMVYIQHRNAQIVLKVIIALVIKVLFLVQQESTILMSVDRQIQVVFHVSQGLLVLIREWYK